MDDDLGGAEAAGDVGDVTNSEAFITIEQLTEQGKLVEDRAVLLKARYKELHDRVLQIYANDSFLLKRARQKRKELEAEKKKVEECGDVALKDDATIKTLKKELADQEQKLSLAQEKESYLQVEALELDRKRQTLAHDHEEALAQETAKIQPRIEATKKEIDDLGKSIDASDAEHKRLKKEREELLLQEQKIKEDIEKANAQKFEADAKLEQISKEPERIQKTGAIVGKNLAKAEREVRHAREKLNVYKTAIANLEKKGEELRQDLLDIENTKTAEKAKAETAKSHYEQAKNEREKFDTNEHEAETRRKNAEEELRKKAVEINNERKLLEKTQREKDEGMKYFKKLEQAKADLNADTLMIRKQMEILKREKAQLSVQREAYRKELDDLRADVDILINNFLKEEISEKRYVADKEQMHQLIREMEEEVAHRAAEEQELRRQQSALSIKREQMSRDHSRNQAKVQLAKSEWKVKEVVLLEFNKRLEDLKLRLNNVVEHWHRVKRDRSAKAQLIQTSSQTMSETQEKIKILENELEVLRRESLIKDQNLKKAEREKKEFQQEVKNKLMERNRWARKLLMAKTKEEELKRQMSKLNSVITTTEDEMLNLKKSYEDSVEKRNFTGIQLIDRNDELCILYEKANIQESVLKRGMKNLNEREEDIRKMAIDLSDVQRKIDLCQKILPQVRDMEEDLAESLLQLEEERWRAETLENDLTDPTNTDRWRKIGKVGVDRSKMLKQKKELVKEAKAQSAALAKSITMSSPQKMSSTAASPSKGQNGGGQDDTAAGGNGDGGNTVNSPSAGGRNAGDNQGPSDDYMDLTRKQQELEERLASVNEKLMEKDLILEEITELSNRLRKQALSGRDFTLALAKKVNGYQFGIKKKTKRMMATLSELSMVQASSIKLEMDVKSAEETLQEAKARFEEGDAPTDDIRRSYEKALANTQRQREILKEQRSRMSASMDEDPKKVRTTADPRANAYMEGDSELMLPKPYGVHAPFKPTVSHNTTRFYRKQQQPEIDFDA